MRLNRFYTERTNLTLGSSVKLESDQAQHIRKTLRLSPKDRVIIFNGQKEYLAELKKVRNDFATAILLEIIHSNPKHKSVEIDIFMSIIRPKNFESVIEKLTELGIDNIYPMTTEYSQIEEGKIGNKYERWNKIIIETCKQSERIRVPKLSDPVNFNEISDLLKSYDMVYFFTIVQSQNERLLGKDVVENYDITPISDFKNFSGHEKVAFLIGPEGGFSKFEHEKAKDEYNLKFFSLGGMILKADTAAICAMSILGHEYSS